MGGKPSIVWFHQDLRLKDNPALVEAIKQGGAVIPLYIWELSEEGEWGPGGASRVWLHQSLKSLDMSLRARGSALVLRRGESIPVLRSVIRETGADAVYWNRRYEPHAIGMDQQVKTELRSNGIHAESFCASLLFEPWDVRTRQGTPFKVFTPFWKACLAAPDPPFPLSVPSTIPSLKHRPQTLSLEDLRLKPQMEWVQGILKAWDVGEEAAHNALLRFLKRGIGVYSKDRERPDRTGSSRLSPYLHHGELSPRTVWHLVSKWREMHKGGVEAAQDYLRELIWREFAYHLLFHFPETVSAPLRAEFMDIGRARRLVGDKVALQGNLDPNVLFAPPEAVATETRRVLDAFGNHPGHVFNLGHGISQYTPPESVSVLVDTVHAHSRAIRAGA